VRTGVPLFFFFANGFSNIRLTTQYLDRTATINFVKVLRYKNPHNILKRTSGFQSLLQIVEKSIELPLKQLLHERPTRIEILWSRETGHCWIR
jgi:hypothetical protein